VLLTYDVDKPKFWDIKKLNNSQVKLKIDEKVKIQQLITERYESELDELERNKPEPLIFINTYELKKEIKEIEDTERYLFKQLSTLNTEIANFESLSSEKCKLAKKEYYKKIAEFDEKLLKKHQEYKHASVIRRLTEEDNQYLDVLSKIELSSKDMITLLKKEERINKIIKKLFFYYSYNYTEKNQTP